ncbi:hypothetical protein M2436_006036 [Streptomyces sp. HB372]|nr:hypothetical protein [Streptomyces sp. HB372]
MTCHVPLRGARYGLPLALVTVLLAGCSGAADDRGETEKRDASTRASASPDPGGGTGSGPSPEQSLVPDPARLPKTRAEARDFIDRVIAGPDSFGPGVVKRSPYESDPATWPVLGEDCVWQQQKPAYSVLATLTRSFELPAEQGKGPVRLGAVVTVHRTREDAAWEMAESIEESMRCPTQQLREGELIGSMVAAALLGGEATQTTSEDSLSEMGQYQSSELGRTAPLRLAAGADPAVHRRRDRQGGEGAHPAGDRRPRRPGAGRHAGPAGIRRREAELRPGDG